MLKFSYSSPQEYIIRVQRGPVPENSWTIQKRYSDFVKLDEELKFASLEFQLPPKKVFGNKEREFIAERQHGLQVKFTSVCSQ